MTEKYYKYTITLQTPNDRKSHTIELYQKNTFDAVLDAIELLQSAFDQDIYGDRLQPLFVLDSFGKYFEIDTDDFFIEHCDRNEKTPCPFNLFEDIEKETTKIGQKAFNELNYEHLISFHENVDVRNKTMIITAMRKVNEDVKNYIIRYCLRKYGFTAEIF